MQQALLPYSLYLNKDCRLLSIFIKKCTVFLIICMLWCKQNKKKYYTNRLEIQHSTHFV